MPGFRNICFTLNNYTQDEYDYILALNVFKYLVVGKEIGESGTPHLQGYATLVSQMRFNKVKNLFPRCHIETRKGSHKQASDYCKKDGDFVEKGTPPSSGKRTDLDDVKQMLDNGATEKEIADAHFGSWVRYNKSFKAYKALCVGPKKVPVHKLYPWQEELFSRLRLPSDDRLIVFVVDLTGNKGKSWFSRYTQELLKGVQVMKPGKYADMAYELDSTSLIVFIDCSRSKTEHLNYDFLESLKDGAVFSPKYESYTKYFSVTPHVVVLMNEDPDYEKLSTDRYSIVNI